METIAAAVEAAMAMARQREGDDDDDGQEDKLSRGGGAVIVIVAFRSIVHTISAAEFHLKSQQKTGRRRIAKTESSVVVVGGQLTKVGQWVVQHAKPIVCILYFCWWNSNRRTTMD